MPLWRENSSHQHRQMLQKDIVIVTPWLGSFAGGAESLARGMAREFRRRGLNTIVFTTCSRSPYHSWWKDYYQPGTYNFEGVQVRRFRTNLNQSPYKDVILKIHAQNALTAGDEEDFFNFGINSNELCDALGELSPERYEVLALPYFHGLTHSAVNAYPGRVSLVPCFHDEPQFYWRATERLLVNAKHIFYNSPEEKEMTIKQYGRTVGRSVVEGTVAGVGIELTEATDDPLPAQLSLPANYFVYAGRKERGKNVPLLCDWFTEHVRRTQTTMKLVFIGGGDNDLLPRSDHFLDLGFVSEATKQEVITRSRAMVNLSNNESFSIVIMEGWLLGVPPIVSAECPVMKGHVRRCNGGLYVYSSDEFSAALDYLVRNDAIRDQLASNGRRYVARNFSSDAVLARYLATFAEPQCSVAG